LLAAGARPRRRLERPLDLRVEDAVSYERADYLVRAIVTYFAGGRDWKAYQLHDGKQERWLEARAEGNDLAWYEPVAVPDGADGAGDATVSLNGIGFDAGERGTATASIDSAAGQREGVFVEYRRYAAPSGSRLVVERWPDGPRALLGGPIAIEDLQLWTKPPATE
jgi:hypothetical protein